MSLDKSTTSDAVSGWESKIDDISGKTITVTITTEPDANIGRYEPFIETKLKEKEGFTLYEFDGFFYILFNPWCKGLYLSLLTLLLNGPRQANLVLIAYASSEGSGETAHPRSLARTFAARSFKQ